MTAGPLDLPALSSVHGRRERGADPTAAFRAGGAGTVDTIATIPALDMADAARKASATGFVRPASRCYDVADLAMGAADVLRSNDIGTMVTAAPALYPHMWSWDAAFISIGLAHLDVERAGQELRTLLAAQWADGMLPHIVYGNRGGYFPGPGRWGTAELSAAAPKAPLTSGICQPPVHAIAVGRIVEVTKRGTDEDRAAGQRLVRDVWGSLYRWHAWLAQYRDPDGTGLIAVVHGWESGMDNSPRWDLPYSAVVPGLDLPSYVRLDRELVRDGAERPTDLEYDRYLWLIEEMRQVGYSPEKVVETCSFLVADVFVSAVFAAACDVLADLGDEFGQPADQVAALRAWAARSRTAVAGSCHPETGMARDFDCRTGQWIDVETLAGFAPLISGGLPADAERALLDTLHGPSWSGHPDLVAAVPPTVSPDSEGFKSREYWRGPQWPVISWLFGWAHRQHGHTAEAEKLRAESLKLVGDGAFSEYYEPVTGEALGSRRQSWTAAVVLDWLDQV